MSKELVHLSLQPLVPSEVVLWFLEVEVASPPIRRIMRMQQLETIVNCSLT